MGDAEGAGQGDSAAAGRGENDDIFMGRFAGGKLRRLIEVIRSEVGNDPELTKQALTEVFALDRQNLHDHFEGRLEYARHVIARREALDRGIVQYGLQTLKWSFLLNAGAIALVMAYVGAATGKSFGSIAAYAPIIRELWPFVAGCTSVTLAGAAAYFSFCYFEAVLPSPEALNNFLAPAAKSWPVGRFQKTDESPADFIRRFGWKVNGSRFVAIGFAVASAIFFAVGVVFVMEAVLA
jgi:hypothetical protein